MIFDFPLSSASKFHNKLDFSLFAFILYDFAKHGRTGKL